MADISRILALIKITSFGISIILTLIYSIPILFIRRFQHRINILTLNICLAMICTSIYWMVYFIMWEYYIEYLFTQFTCTFLFYVQNASVIQLPFAFVTITFNRYCSIVHPGKAFFKKKKFVAICIVSQWIVCCIISLPFLTSIQPYCVQPPWLSIYLTIIVAVIPTLICLIINLCIFKHVHASSRRVQPQNDISQTNLTMAQRPKINQRDLYIIRHTIFMFSMFIIGWSPIFLLVAIDYHGNVLPLVYTSLQVLAVISSLGCMLDLFLYNHDLRKYLLSKMIPCF